MNSAPFKIHEISIGLVVNSETMKNNWNPPPRSFVILIWSDQEWKKYDLKLKNKISDSNIVVLENCKFAHFCLTSFNVYLLNALTCEIFIMLSLRGKWNQYSKRDKQTKKSKMESNETQ